MSRAQQHRDFTEAYWPDMLLYAWLEHCHVITNNIMKIVFLEIFYNENDKVIEFNYKKEILPNDLSLSELDEKSIASDRKTFEFLRNILSNLRRRDN